MDGVLDTETLPGAARVDAWRRAAAALFPAAAYECDASAGFAGRIAWHRGRDVQVCLIAGGPQSIRRTRAHLADGDDAIELNLQLGGRGASLHDGARLRTEPRTLVGYDAARPYELSFDAPFRQLTFKVRRARLGAPPPGRLGRAIDGRAGQGAVLAAFAESYAACALEARRPVAALEAPLIAVMRAVLAGEDAAPDARVPPRQRTLARIRADLQARLHEDDLTPAAIAARHGVSVRHLHALFAQGGESVGRWLLAQRLERCRRDLEDPAFADWPVSMIARRWGLHAPAHFSRSFRRAYGLSPTDLRAAARRAPRAE